MALQGTIETFALPDVMQLLASTRKSGCLHLEGSRGSGSIWVDSGQIVGSEVSGAPHADGPVEVVFELLRFKEGNFVFEADEEADSPTSPVEVEATLADAEAMLEEWRSVEAVVPSLDSWVTLSPSLPESEVTVDGDSWELIVAIAGGVTVGGLGETFSLGEMPISKRVKELIEAGLAEVGDAPEDAVVAPVTTLRDMSVSEPDASTDDLSSEPEIATSAAVDAEFETGVASDVDDDVFDPGALVVDLEPIGMSDETESGADFAPAADFDDTEAVSVDSPTDAAEIARQLANLSPKAARAVAAAAKATTPEERELALADVDDEEEAINRDLLIRFLGSVNG